MIGIFVTIKIIAPINKMLAEVKKVNVVSSIDSKIKSKNEMTYLSRQFNTLVDEVETNRRNFEVQEKELKERLYIDSLTGLQNRTALEDNIKGKEFVSIVLLDIDSFADINELYGFNTGDLALAEIGKMLLVFSEKYDVTPYRLHGNVFGLATTTMMNFSTYDEFISEASKLFRNNPIIIGEEKLEIYISVTLGISIAQEETIKTFITVKLIQKSLLKTLFIGEKK